MVEIIALARPFADTGKDRVPAVFLGDIANEFLDHHRLAYPCPAEQSHLPAFHKRADEIDRLDTRFKDFRFR